MPCTASASRSKKCRKWCWPISAPKASFVRSRNLLAWYLLPAILSRHEVDFAVFFAALRHAMNKYFKHPVETGGARRLAAAVRCPGSPGCAPRRELAPGSRTLGKPPYSPRPSQTRSGHFYSTMRKSRNPYISMKTNDRCHFYSTMKPGGKRANRLPPNRALISGCSPAQQ
jgi:hypothetical protein